MVPAAVTVCRGYSSAAGTVVRWPRRPLAVLRLATPPIINTTRPSLSPRCWGLTCDKSQSMQVSSSLQTTAGIESETVGYTVWLLIGDNQSRGKGACLKSLEVLSLIIVLVLV